MAFHNINTMYDNEIINTAVSIAVANGVPVHQISMTMVLDHVKNQELEQELETGVLSYLYDIQERRMVNANDQATHNESRFHMIQFDYAIRMHDYQATVFAPNQTQTFTLPVLPPLPTANTLPTEMDPLPMEEEHIDWIVGDITRLIDDFTGED